MNTGGHRSKFGIDVEDARSVLSQAGRFLNLDLAGLHVHIGSQLANTVETVAALQRVLELATLHPIRNLDIGGGFPVPYRPDDELPDPAVFAEAVQQVLKANPGGPFEIAIEPGRSIIADAGVLVAAVQYTKVREGRRIVVCDASMTELIRPALYDAYHHIVTVKDSQPSSLLADVVGPVCETGDFIALARWMPDPRQGDLLAVMTAGAYGAVQSGTYNSRPLIAEVLVRGEDYALVRPRQTYEELIGLDRIPSWLHS
jgi:diaminopimelate decarboxylase